MIGTFKEALEFSKIKSDWEGGAGRVYFNRPATELELNAYYSNWKIDQFLFVDDLDYNAQPFESKELSQKWKSISKLPKSKRAAASDNKILNPYPLFGKFIVDIKTYGATPIVGTYKDVLIFAKYKAEWEGGSFKIIFDKPAKYNDLVNYYECFANDKFCTERNQRW